MTWVLGALLFIASLVGATAIAPVFFGTLTPSLPAAVFVLGVALMRFRPAFWFTVVAGLISDFLDFGASQSVALALFLVFFAIRTVLSRAGWEDPMRRIVAVAVGVAAWPLAFAASGSLSPFFFGTAAAVSVWPNVGSPAFFSELLFSILWLTLFVWVSVVRFRARHRVRLERI